MIDGKMQERLDRVDYPASYYESDRDMVGAAHHLLTRAIDNCTGNRGNVYALIVRIAHGGLEPDWKDLEGIVAERCEELFDKGLLEESINNLSEMGVCQSDSTHGGRQREELLIAAAFDYVTIKVGNIIASKATEILDMMDEEETNA